ncbi:hypothetical protein F3Y22_tig00016212pilonHSYRG00091 [Hibiscus syriacus]|uniref:HAT C-terminal dimerisation domain-containing protein n=1 Tax=Hibiscus syriacus TaxID=106335 RepID=A0A6A3BXM5_HIBSY|nr:hypothetical protein F3Y22_tig00016212pilonHSYRG00091 [Hibiscus syriacus]
MADKSEQHNTTTTSLPSISKPTTTASSTPTSECGDKSQKQTDNADPMVIPLTSRHSSTTWSHFTRKRVGKEIKAESKDGGSNDTLSLTPYEFHQDKGRKDLAEMIILHEYPLTIAEHYDFKKYSNTLQPGFKVSCRNTTKKDIMQRYETEKEGISALFLYVPTPHTTVVLAEHLKECIHSWNIDIKLSSITVDNCTTNDAMIDILHQEFPYGSLMLHGRFLHMLCCAHILNLIVQDGLSAVIKIGLDRIRDSVGFWIASDKRNKKFEEVAKQLVLECTKKLLLDCKTMWNSTYDMLMVALNYKEVFVILSGRESLFKNLTLNEDWEKMVLVMLEKYNKYWADVNGLMDVATILDPSYPTLQQISKDILSIHVSTVPSESAFSTGGRVIGPYHSRLLPEMIEALMCAQNWLWADIKDGSSRVCLQLGSGCGDGFENVPMRAGVDLKILTHHGWWAGGGLKNFRWVWGWGKGYPHPTCPFAIPTLRAVQSNSVVPQ